jgi:hypothetical protein
MHRQSFTLVALAGLAMLAVANAAGESQMRLSMHRHMGLVPCK